MAKHHPDLVMCRKQPGIGELIRYFGAFLLFGRVFGGRWGAGGNDGEHLEAMGIRESIQYYCTDVCTGVSPPLFLCD